ncbi:MAG: hypothetical protein KKB50_07530 [Planctomycetes bacterium]|nr:hypothetical protein [Planctomycetota bacterium]
MIIRVGVLSGLFLLASCQETPHQPASAKASTVGYAAHLSDGAQVQITPEDVRPFQCELSSAAAERRDPQWIAMTRRARPIVQALSKRRFDAGDVDRFLPYLYSDVKAVRTYAVASCGEFSPHAFATFEDALVSFLADPNPRARLWVARTLCENGSPETRRFVACLRLAREAAYARAVAGRTPSVTNSPTSQPFAITVADIAPLQIAAGEAAAAEHGPDANSEANDSPTTLFRELERAAARLRGAEADPDAVRAYLPFLYATDARVRQRALREVETLGPTAFAALHDVLVACIVDSDGQVRLQALRTLAACAPDETRAMLRKFQLSKVNEYSLAAQGL